MTGGERDKFPLLCEAVGGMTRCFKRRGREGGAGRCGPEQSQGNEKSQKAGNGYLVHVRLIWLVSRGLSELDVYVSSGTGHRGLIFRCRLEQTGNSFGSLGFS